MVTELLLIFSGVFVFLTLLIPFSVLEYRTKKRVSLLDSFTFTQLYEIPSCGVPITEPSPLFRKNNWERPADAASYSIALLEDIHARRRILNPVAADTEPPISILTTPEIIAKFDTRNSPDADAKPTETAYLSYFKDDGFGNLIHVGDQLYKSIRFMETLKEY